MVPAILRSTAQRLLRGLSEPTLTVIPLLAQALQFIDLPLNAGRLSPALQKRLQNCRRNTSKEKAKKNSCDVATKLELNFRIVIRSDPTEK